VQVPSINSTAADHYPIPPLIDFSALARKKRTIRLQKTGLARSSFGKLVF
jgi:hypothetical protein